MRGDKSKPNSSFSRWIDHFWDGCFSTTKKGKRRVPSQHYDKRYEKRWRRRYSRKELEDAEQDHSSKQT